MSKLHDKILYPSKALTISQISLHDVFAMVCSICTSNTDCDKRL